jgi:acyl-CoA thioesterase FadM
VTQTPTPADYPLTLEIPARFADLDVNMHLNNTAAATFYEDARTQFHLTRLRRWLGAAENPSRLFVGRTTIEYFSEGPYPATYTVGIGVCRLSRSSFVDALALFVEDRIIGGCETVMVHSHGTGGAPIPEDMRALLETMRAPSVLRFGG